MMVQRIKRGNSIRDSLKGMFGGLATEAAVQKKKDAVDAELSADGSEASLSSTATSSKSGNSGAGCSLPSEDREKDSTSIVDEKLEASSESRRRPYEVIIIPTSAQHGEIPCEQEGPDDLPANKGDSLPVEHSVGDFHQAPAGGGESGQFARGYESDNSSPRTNICLSDIPMEDLAGDEIVIEGDHEDEDWSPDGENDDSSDKCGNPAPVAIDDNTREPLNSPLFKDDEIVPSGASGVTTTGLLVIWDGLEVQQQLENDSGCAPLDSSGAHGDEGPIPERGSNLLGVEEVRTEEGGVVADGLLAIGTEQGDVGVLKQAPSSDSKNHATNDTSNLRDRATPKDSGACHVESNGEGKSPSEDEPNNAKPQSSKPEPIGPDCVVDLTEVGEDDAELYQIYLDDSHMTPRSKLKSSILMSPSAGSSTSRRRPRFSFKGFMGDLCTERSAIAGAAAAKPIDPSSTTDERRTEAGVEGKSGSNGVNCDGPRPETDKPLQEDGLNDGDDDSEHNLQPKTSDESPEQQIASASSTKVVVAARRQRSRSIRESIKGMVGFLAGEQVERNEPKNNDEAEPDVLKIVSEVRSTSFIDDDEVSAFPSDDEQEEGDTSNSSEGEDDTDDDQESSSHAREMMPGILATDRRASSSRIEMSLEQSASSLAASAIHEEDHESDSGWGDSPSASGVADDNRRTRSLTALFSTSFTRSSHPQQDAKHMSASYATMPLMEYNLGDEDDFSDWGGNFQEAMEIMQQQTGRKSRSQSSSKTGSGRPAQGRGGIRQRLSIRESLKGMVSTLASETAHQAAKEEEQRKWKEREKRRTQRRERQLAREKEMVTEGPGENIPQNAAALVSPRNSTTHYGRQGEGDRPAAVTCTFTDGSDLPSTEAPAACEVTLASVERCDAGDNDNGEKRETQSEPVDGVESSSMSAGFPMQEKNEDTANSEGRDSLPRCASGESEAALKIDSKPSDASQDSASPVAIVQPIAPPASQALARRASNPSSNSRRASGRSFHSSLSSLHSFGSRASFRDSIKGAIGDLSAELKKIAAADDDDGADAGESDNESRRNIYLSDIPMADLAGDEIVIEGDNEDEDSSSDGESDDSSDADESESEEDDVSIFDICNMEMLGCPRSNSLRVDALADPDDSGLLGGKSSASGLAAGADDVDDELSRLMRGEFVASKSFVPDEDEAQLRQQDHVNDDDVPPPPNEPPQRSRSEGFANATMVIRNVHASDDGELIPMPFPNGAPTRRSIRKHHSATTRASPAGRGRRRSSVRSSIKFLVSDLASEELNALK